MRLKKSLVVIAYAAIAMTTVSAAFSQEISHALESQVTASGVKYVSGGIGAGSQQAMERVRKDYNLRLTFARPGSGEYLSDVRVRAENNSGETALDVVSHGPLLFARLPAGSYRVKADFEGKTQVRAVTIRKGHSRGLIFYFAK
ncbi:carboxypeptidase regulatory-like domain-containing protein [Paraburkholderia aromaticivorans]|uniref:carboxypeptidase regulatory-like domain-containing protein n=1 Tax=Paraburkholderia aromaticivorans TaxID=2026199 RepID=UPI0038B953D6